MAAAVAWAAESGPVPLASPRAPSGRLLAATDALEVAGSGSNLPLTRRLLESWRERSGQRFILHSSIGTTGAVQAVRDGVIHIGLLSRPLSEQESSVAGPDYLRITYAWSVVAFAANPSVRDHGVRAGEIVELLRGRTSTWSDGSPRVFILRERGDSSHRAAMLRIEGFGAAERDAQSAGRFRVLYSDVELRYSLLGTIGAVGLTDLGAGSIDGLPLVPLALDGVEPTLENARSGRYRLIKPLIALAPARHDARVESFLLFLRSPEGLRLIETSGFLATEPAGGAP